MNPRGPDGRRRLDREVCHCAKCCAAIPGRAAVAARQRAAFKKRFFRVVERGALDGVA